MAKGLPSPAQARLLANAWGCEKTFPVGGYIDPTTRACVNRGWLVHDGTFGTFPSGTHFSNHIISEAGVDALMSFLLNQFHRRRDAMPAERASREGSS